MIPTLVGSLRAGGVAALVSGEKMTRFLDTLYALHIAAIKPFGAHKAESHEAAATSGSSAFACKTSRNVHDFIADIVLGTWLSFDKEGSVVQARLCWISPLRTTYIFTGRGSAEVMFFSPEELAWEVSGGAATLILEPVPLFERAVSVTLDYLAEQKARTDMTSPKVDSPSATARDSVAALA